MASISASTKPSVRPGLRQPGGKRTSVREVRLIGIPTLVEDWGPGDRVHWWGRSYEVEATESLAEWAPRAEEAADPGASRYLHLRPLEEPGHDTGHALS